MGIINLETLSENTIQGLTARGKLITEKIFSVKDANIDSKIFHVWKSKGLLDFLERGKWARLSLVDYLWLQVLESMRKFGCSIKLMKHVYDELFTKAFKENLAAKTLQSNLEYYRAQSKIRSLTWEETEILNLIEENIKFPILNIAFRNEISYFYKLVLDCLQYKADAGLIIFEDETFTTFVNLPFQQNESANTIALNARPHLYIPISSYILTFLADEEKQTYLTQTGLLSEDEYRVIREIRNKNVKAITITFNDVDHRLEKIECDKKGLIKGEDAKKVMALLGLKNYSGIELNTRDGKTLSFTHTEKKLF